MLALVAITHDGHREWPFRPKADTVRRQQQAACSCRRAAGEHAVQLLSTYET